tara:strand:+ start:8950 stop:9126 length:177 start_codon:yes stop_codon:yes gene_type:complete
MADEIMKSLGDIDVLLSKGEFLQQNTNVQGQILSLYFGANYKYLSMEEMLTELETYKA